MMRFALLLTLLVLATDCTPSKLRPQEVTQGEPPDSALIRAVRLKSNRAINAHDLPALVSTMLPEMEVTGGNGGHLSGRAAMEASFANTFADPTFGGYVREMDRIDVSTAQPLAAEHGHWVGRWRRPDGVQVVQGVYLAMWRRTEDGWKIRSELFVTLSCTGSRQCGP